MWKYILSAAFLFGGCSYFEFNFAMCENIGADGDPQMLEKCRNYNEQEAQKAFDKPKTKTSISEDSLEFKK